MMHPAPLPISPEDRLDLQIGTALVASIKQTGFESIRDLRSRLARDGKHLPLVHIRDNATLAPSSFLLHHDGRLTADGDFATIGDILQALACTAVPTPPPPTVATPQVDGRYVVIN